MFNIVSSHLVTRNELAPLCNAREYQTVVEIGTDQGVFAQAFMAYGYSGDLLCVDPYPTYWESPYDRSGDMLQALIALQPYFPRVRFIREESVRFASNLPKWWANSLGMVFVDGLHEYHPVKLDIEAWWPHLRFNGVLAGHDFDNLEVRKAVEEFASSNNVNLIRVITEPNLPSSWYIDKAVQ